MALTGNKGEWSEVYAFLRLLADGKLFAADEQLNRIDDMFFPIIRIIREEIRGIAYEYRAGSVVKVCLNDDVLMEVPAEVFKVEAQNLLSRINEQSGNRTFSVEETTTFINSLYVNKLSAPAADKSDINIELHDANTGYEHVSGFSIKSKLGSPSTLLNASGSTGFIYSVEGLAVEDIERINTIETPRKIKDRFSEIEACGGRLTFLKAENTVFRNNLYMIDSQMPEIVAQMLLGYFTGHGNSCADLTKYACETMPILHDRPPIHPESSKMNFYTHKVKELLCAVALGMKPATPWDGTDEATGGYIVIKHDGDVLCYHIYNRNAFRGYLLTNTKFEGASSTRHNYGVLYRENGETYIRLTLQIRFV